MQDILVYTQKKIDILEKVLNENIDPMRIDKRMRRLSRQISQDLLAAHFEEGKQIKGITWTEEPAYVPHRCFVSDEVIYPCTVAYKGTRTIELLDTLEITLKQETIWLTKEEFTMRRLKGQI